MLRQKYVAHVARMFVLMGDGEADAKAHADVVMSIETALAKGSMTLVDQRDPRKQFHPASERQLQVHHARVRLEGLSWPVMGLARNDRFNVSQPQFFKALDAQLRARQARRPEDLPALACGACVGAVPVASRSSPRTSTTTAGRCAA